jgi:hypothetical protein
MLTIKYNSSGAQQWVRVYNSPGNYLDYARSMAIDASGNIYITGVSLNNEGALVNYYDFATVKYSPAGIKKWIAIYNGPENMGDEASAIEVKDSVIAVTGHSYHPDLSADFTTIKYVQKTFFISPSQKIGNLISEVDNLVQWGNLTQGNGNALTVKLNAALKKVNQGNNNAAINQLCAFNNQVDAFVRTGNLVPEYGETLTAETDDIIQDLNRGLNVQIEQPVSFAISQNYPNPFNPVTVINFSLPAREFVTITVYDILGNEVEVLVNEFMNEGSHNISWDASRFASGVYFYRINAGGFTETKKMLLIK